MVEETSSKFDRNILTMNPWIKLNQLKKISGVIIGYNEFENGNPKFSYCYIFFSFFLLRIKSQNTFIIFCVKNERYGEEKQ